MPAAQTARTAAMAGDQPPGDPCIIVIFGASGDLTKRLLVPALYNLVCDGLLSEKLAVVGTASSVLSTDDLRSAMSRDIQEFKTRKELDKTVWENLCARLHYTPGRFDDEA